MKDRKRSDAEAITAALIVSEYCQQTGCLYCVFMNRYQDKEGTRRERCELKRRANEWKETADRWNVKQH